MRKRIARTLSLAVLAAFTSLVSAQVPVGPFAPGFPPLFNSENFDTIGPGGYISVPIMAGAATAARVSTNGALFVDNVILSPFSPPNTMWGRNTAVELSFAQTKKRFGGMFRVPSAGSRRRE